MNCNFGLLGRKLNSIAEEVVHDLLEPGRIGLEVFRTRIVQLDVNNHLLALGLKLVAVSCLNYDFFNIYPFVFDFEVSVFEIDLILEVVDVKLDHAVAVFDSFKQFSDFGAAGRLVD